MICFEHPLSERVRSFLRIEHLFSRFNAESACCSSSWAHHLALFTLFEIMESAGRAEVKLDILQELERQKQILVNSDHFDVGTNLLAQQLKEVTDNLQCVRQKFGQHLRENEWLMAIKQRMLVPGGTSPFDLSSYYYWQKLPHQKRFDDLQKWISTLRPTQEAVMLLLRILRSNSRSVACVAQKGNYQHTSLVVQNIHLLTIQLDMAHQALPEVSANKYFTHIRFLSASQESARGKPLEQDIPFKMIMCSFDSVME